MKFVWIAIIFIFGYKDGHTQIKFKETYGTGVSNGATGIIPFPNNEFFVSAQGGDSARLIKSDPPGNILWTKSIHKDNLFTVLDISKLKDGNLLFASSDFNNTIKNFSLFKLDTAGNIIWKKSYSLPFDIQARPPQQTSDNGFIVPFIYNKSIFPSHVQSYCLLKTDSAGIIQWCKSYNVDSIDLLGMAVKQTDDEGYIFLNLNLDYFGINYMNYAIKLDSNGNVSHANGLTWLELRYRNPIHRMNSDSYIMAVEGILYCFDENANVKWEYSFHDQIDIFSSVYINDNRIAICGYSYDSSGSRPVFIEIDSSAQIIKIKKYSSALRDYFLAMCQMPDSGFCFAGAATDTNGINTKILIMRTDSDGNSGCNEIPYSLTLDTIDYNTTFPVAVYVINLFPQISNDSLHFSLVSETPDFSCAILNQISDDANDPDVIKIFPNPAKGFLTIRSETDFNDTEISIYNLLGQKIIFENYNGKHKQIYLPLPAGIYIIQINKPGFVCSRKIVIE
jgi:hypothetical protein